MGEPAVNDCNVCTEDGWYSVKDDRIEPRETCPNCSGAGRVVGVPADSIVVADDTGRVAVFPKMTREEAVEELGHYAVYPPKRKLGVTGADALDAPMACVPAAVVNLVLDGATEEGAPDARPI